MLSQFQQQELQQLKQTANRKLQLNTLKDRCKAKQMDLRRQVNQLESVGQLITSTQFQELLQSSIDYFQEFKNVKKDYEALPGLDTEALKRQQLSNEQLQQEVASLQNSIEFQKQRQANIEQAIQQCEQELEQQFAKKSEVEREIMEIRKQMASVEQLKQTTSLSPSDFPSINQQEEELLLDQRYSELQFLCSRDIKHGNQQQSSLLINIAEKYLQLQRLQKEHDSTQKAFNHYSSGESEHDLIAEQDSLNAEIQKIQEQIEREQQQKARLLADCESNVKKEAIKQAHFWMNNKMEEIAKNKRIVNGLLEIIVPSEEQEPEVQNIKDQLNRLRDSELQLLEKMRMPSEMII